MTSNDRDYFQFHKVLGMIRSKYKMGNKCQCPSKLDNGYGLVNGFQQVNLHLAHPSFFIIQLFQDNMQGSTWIWTFTEICLEDVRSLLKFVHSNDFETFLLAMGCGEFSNYIIAFNVLSISIYFCKFLSFILNS